MADGTKIEWTDATWNVVIGCDKVSPGCDHCYAIRTAHRFQEHPNPAVAAAYAGTEQGGDWTGRVNLVESRLDLPLRWKRPRRIFVNAQSDLFHANVPDEFIARVWAVMALSPRHTFQILTKRHGRMRSLLSSPKFRDLMAAEGYAYNRSAVWRWEDVQWPLRNVWLGVSVEDQARANLRVPALLDTPAAVRWLSCEPLLGPVRLDYMDIDHGRFYQVNTLTGRNTDMARPCEDVTSIDWVVVGGESGPGARPMHPDWARQLRDQCVEAGVPFLFKQWGDHDGTGRRVGKRAAGRVLDGRTWDEYPQAVSHA